MSDQLEFFSAATATPWPAGFRYEPEIITPAEERALLAAMPTLPFKEFEFHGYTGKRRTVSFGWSYDFEREAIAPAEPLPPFLDAVRTAAARFAGLVPEALQHALVTEYSPGAAIGWHRDKGVFDDVVGVSLLSRCQFRLRRRVGEKWERVTVEAEPRSAYQLRGPSRTDWEHSIPAVSALRYSITFRTLR